MSKNIFKVEETIRAINFLIKNNYRIPYPLSLETSSRMVDYGRMSVTSPIEYIELGKLLMEMQNIHQELELSHSKLKKEKEKLQLMLGQVYVLEHNYIPIGYYTTEYDAKAARNDLLKLKSNINPDTVRVIKEKVKLNNKITGKTK